jgi:hypothetical protein
VDYQSSRPVVINTRAQHYRDEAARIIEIAESAGEASIRVQLLEIAQRYLQFALNADAAEGRTLKKPLIRPQDRG